MKNSTMHRLGRALPIQPTSRCFLRGPIPPAGVLTRVSSHRRAGPTKQPPAARFTHRAWGPTVRPVFNNPAERDGRTARTRPNGAQTAEDPHSIGAGACNGATSGSPRLAQQIGGRCNLLGSRPPGYKRNRSRSLLCPIIVYSTKEIVADAQGEGRRWRSLPTVAKHPRCIDLGLHRDSLELS